MFGRKIGERPPLRSVQRLHPDVVRPSLFNSKSQGLAVRSKMKCSVNLWAQRAKHKIEVRLHADEMNCWFGCFCQIHHRDLIPESTGFQLDSAQKRGHGLSVRRK